MHQNNPNLDLTASQYEGAKLGDKITQKGKPMHLPLNNLVMERLIHLKNGVFLN